MLEIARGWPQDRRGRRNPFRNIGVDLHESDVPGQNDNGNAALGNRDADSPLENLRKQLGIGDELYVVAAIPEQAFRMGRLKVVDPDLGAGDVGGDRQNRHAIALTVKQTIDQMQIAWTAAAGANGEVPRQVRFGSRRECRSLFMPHVDPVD
jgi:hypothetical protein